MSSDFEHMKADLEAALAGAEGTALLGDSAASAREIVDQVLYLSPTGSKLAGRTLLLRARLHLASGNPRDAAADLTSASTALVADPQRAAVCRIIAARVDNRRGNSEAAKAALDVLDPVIADASPEGKLTRTMTRGELALDRGDLEEAGHHFKLAISQLAGQEADHERYQAAMALCFICQQRGDNASAIKHVRVATEVASRHHDLACIAEASMTWGNLLAARDELPAARARWEEALATGALSATTQSVLMCLSARAELAAGVPKRALDLALAGAKTAAAADFPSGFADATVIAAEAQTRLGLIAEAAATLQAGESVLRRRSYTEYADLIADARQGA